MEPKPGFRSSEWWLSVVAMLLGVFMASGLVGDDHWMVKVAGLAMSALTAMGYSAARAKTKVAASLSNGGSAKKK